MTITTYTNKEQSDFFFDNGSEIQELSQAYEAHKQAIIEIQKVRISEIHEEIKKQTNGSWWIWHGWDMGVNSFKGQRLKIGIEASFAASKISPCDKFKIYFTSWATTDYTPYKEILKIWFPNLEPDDKSIKNRVYLHMPHIDGNNMDEIITKLKEYYELLLKITQNQGEISI
jgi:hypothetical protein